MIDPVNSIYLKTQKIDYQNDFHHPKKDFLYYLLL